VEVGDAAQQVAGGPVANSWPMVVVGSFQVTVTFSPPVVSSQ
jgi:hypothetical protein